MLLKTDRASVTLLIAASVFARDFLVAFVSLVLSISFSSDKRKAASLLGSALPILLDMRMLRSRCAGVSSGITFTSPITERNENGVARFDRNELTPSREDILLDRTRNI